MTSGSNADELPAGWMRTTLETIAVLNPRHPTDLPESQLVTFARMAAISDSGPNLDRSKERQLGAVRSGFTHFADGDVLFAKITPSMENGKGAVAHGLKNGLGCGTTELHVIRPLGGIDPHYIYRFLEQESVRRDAAANFTGSAGQLRVPADFLKRLALPLAPLAEQRRIVAKLDDLLGRLSSCQQRLSQTLVLLKRFRQAVLDDACSGQLTADWRLNSRGTFDARETVEAIRRRRSAGATTTRQHALLNDIYGLQEESDPPFIPVSWAFVSLTKLCSSFDYGTSAKSATEGTTAVLRMGNIQDGKIDWEHLKYTSDDAEIARYTLQPETVLFNRTNSPELVGKTALYRGERPAIFAGYLIRINTYQELIPAYLNLCMNTSRARAFCRRIKSDGVSQSNINKQRLGIFEIPFCSVQEQQEIVRRVEEVFAVADELDIRLRRVQVCVDQLTQSLLTKAFRGELVETEVELADRQGRIAEVAQSLIERVHGEQEMTKAAQAAKTRAKRTPRRPAIQDAAVVAGLSQKATALLNELEQRFGKRKFYQEDIAVLFGPNDEETRSAFFELLETSEHDGMPTSLLSMTYVKSREGYSYKSNKER